MRPQDFGGRLLAGRVERGEDGRDGHGLDAAGRDLAGHARHAVGVERGDLAAVIFVTAAQQVVTGAHDRTQIVGPVHERDDRGGRR